MKVTRASMYEVARTVLQGRTAHPRRLPIPTPGRTTGRDHGGARAVADAERPSREGVVDLARETLRETTAFVRARNFVTLPDEPLDIILMPEFQRGVAVAYCDSPGPLDKGQRTFYRSLADPGRLDARSRSTRSCANTTRARSRT